MNLMCPVCNSFMPLYAGCPRCSQPMQDAGRLADYFGDYSPYRPIDDSKRTNGLPDLAHHVCVHIAWCPNCREEQRIAVKEVTDEQLSAFDMTDEST
ncbi:hypothetical protein LOK74_16580 [Brevibacillus humidisoli]|uniref:hypothetical protein n=1 Tax=Brevibacillus humidisoli TaxID=2895522 RepID=UPI001E5E0646|nr:hypothetical protein [Brevibacillus humidisoli]UFJ39660.1 hypothetical protein LOK74_16580 [Brevibacillus humidisoli]